MYRYYVMAVALALVTLPALLIDLPIVSFLREGHVGGDLRKVITLSEVFAHGYGILGILGRWSSCSIRSGADWLGC